LRTHGVNRTEGINAPAGAWAGFWNDDISLEHRGKVTFLSYGFHKLFVQPLHRFSQKERSALNHLFQLIRQLNRAPPV